MLETEEVDDDFFTPVAGTSLANIFGNTTKNIEEPVNDTLKYIPPKPQNIPPKPKPEQMKTTDVIFACSLFGHEWSNNVYTARGQLGFAIVKIHKTGDHNIILYDSNKTTLSCATISPNLTVTIRNLAYISYYDNLRRYWSIYGTEDKITKVAEHLMNLGLTIKHTANENQGPPNPSNMEPKTNMTSELSKTDKESDTDSSVNRKTKASILNRMANMGHSVLPTRAQHSEVTSDSSDTMDTEIQPKTVRHKPVKSVLKKSTADSIISQSQQSSDSPDLVVLPKTEPIDKVSVYTSHSSQLLPVANSSIFTCPSNEFGMFISEQRISNSELRINMNRINDKVDSVLNKMSNLEQGGNTSAQTDILMKLLAEYEHKIKIYEDLLKSRNDKLSIDNILATTAISKNDKEIELLKNKISDLEKFNEDKCIQVSNLQKELQLLQNKCDTEKIAQTKEKHELCKKISCFDSIVNAKDVEIADLNKKYQSVSEDTKSVNDQNIGDKVKNIMNDTFQTISVNFDDNQNYSGDSVKKIVAAVIKKITIQTLNDLK
ncbi:FK506-binding protein 5-like [Trichoplusia ni]|uniref:FK506-binding protein 5-like n=1 Tax=Trichoplusia ni TaxID=7111 RepID=A0A7E5VCI8_TRINI|nr:FK506-binding protein 5-like [Trichoplusia ni]